MEMKEEYIAEIKREFEDLTEKAADTDERIETVKEEVAQVKKKATRAQRRLKSSS